MPTVSPDVMASWPAPNYQNPVTCIGLLVGVEAPMAALMTLAVAARFYSRGVLTRMLGRDDWVMLLAWACTLANSVITFVGTRYGMARHLYDVKPEWVAITLRMNLAFEGLFSLGAALTKISICLTYLRLFPGRQSNKYFCWTAITYCTCWCIATFFAQVIQCRPVSDYWKISKPHRKCIDEQALLIAEAALNSLSDLAVFLWPVRFLWGMKLPREQRLGLIGLFCFGVVICVAGVVRMWYFTIYFASWDIYWQGARNYIILAIETNLGIVCGCLPCCKPVLTKCFPCCFNTTRHMREPELAEHRDDKVVFRPRPDLHIGGRHGWSSDGTTLTAAAPMPLAQRLLMMHGGGAGININQAFQTPAPTSAPQELPHAKHTDVSASVDEIRRSGCSSDAWLGQQHHDEELGLP